MRPPTLHQVWNVLLPLVLLGSCLYCTERAPSGTEDPERVLPDFPARTLVAGPVPVDLRHSSIAEDIAVQRNGKFLYILSYTTLYQISGDTLTIEKTHSVDYQRGKGYLSTAISPDDETIALFKMPRLIVFLRSADLAVTGTLQIGESDYKTKLAFHPSSGYLYALTDRGELYEIDSGAAKVIQKISMATAAADFAISRDGRKVYLTERAGNRVLVYDKAGRKWDEPILVMWGESPVRKISPFSWTVGLNAIAVDSGNDTLYVQQVGTGTTDTIFVIDLAERQVEDHLVVFRGAVKLGFLFDQRYFVTGDKAFRNGQKVSTVINSQSRVANHYIMFPHGMNEYVVNQELKRIYGISYETKPPSVAVLELMNPAETQ